MSGQPDVPKELHTRFVYSFIVPPARREACVVALLADTLLGKAGAWRKEEPHRYYQDELLPHVAKYIHPDGDRSGCVFLRLGPDTAARLFKGVRARAREGRTVFDVALSPLAGIELFLSPDGAGALSIALDASHPALTGEGALDFNYLGARRHRGVGLALTVDHPKEHPERWVKIPLKEQERLERERPAPDAPVDARLGVPGGQFTLEELARRLIAPLDPIGLRWPNTREHEQPVPFVFTVLHFDPSVDFDDVAARQRLAPLGAGLAQVEEPHHAGAVSDDLGVPSAYLNRKHWALLGQLGAAHLVADQAPGPDGKALPFNEERVQRVFMKYFIPTLLALFQRVTLQDAADRAARLAEPGRVDDPTHRHTLWELRHELLRFAARGHFAQVSTRHALHRCYLLAREGLAVEALWESIRRAVGELDAAHTAKSQEKLAADSNAMQHGLHLFEYFFFIVYSAELAHVLLGTVAESAHAQHAEGVVQALHTWGPLVILTAIGGGLLLSRFLTHKGHHGQHG